VESHNNWGLWLWGLFVWLIEPEWCVIKFVLNKYMCGYIVTVGYVFYMWITNCENMFRLFRNIVSVSCRFHAITHKNALSRIPWFGVQSLTVLYSILCYSGPWYNGAQPYRKYPRSNGIKCPIAFIVVKTCDGHFSCNPRFHISSYSFLT